VVAAHPDDETIGAGVLLSRLQDPWVLHVTDGAPRDPRFIWKFQGEPEDYARTRRKELEAAMVLAGIGPDRLRCLGHADLEVAFSMPRLARELAEVFRELAPEMVVTHPYEGGHPDHDSLAFAVRAAARLMDNPPEIVEMSSYHAGAQGMATGRFLSHPEVEETRLELTAGERALKERMLAAFETQSDILKSFLPPGDEVFRPAPAYDFTRPPHEGPLQYELSGFPMTGERWRELARAAAAQSAW
jgi:N-acetylglucosamine malate deacetylase 2